MRVREVVRVLLADGWVELSGKATSHRQFKHSLKPGRVTVANHPGDIPPFTLNSIWKQAGLVKDRTGGSKNA
ncbi:MAG: type II toxin-antitoxin system HicA family toxin [Oscillospiraceae bacterium]|nr:type II toxin-antitoxin system HicA family toxin [Oscillospiraceae bacterium]